MERLPEDAGCWTDSAPEPQPAGVITRRAMYKVHQHKLAEQVLFILFVAVQ